jgi:hypothetical protein
MLRSVKAKTENEREDTKMARAYFYRGGQVRRLKEGTDIAEYRDRHPDAIRCCKPPCISTLERWEEDGIGHAIDGCRVEPDGDCEHGLPSWLKVMAFI